MIPLAKGADALVPVNDCVQRPLSVVVGYKGGTNYYILILINLHYLYY